MLYRDCIFSIETAQCLCGRRTVQVGGAGERTGGFASNYNPTLGLPSLPPPPRTPKIVIPQLRGE